VIEEIYSWKNVADRTEKVYKDVMGVKARTVTD
jgi:hypothetical protein